MTASASRDPIAPAHRSSTTRSRARRARTVALASPVSSSSPSVHADDAASRFLARSRSRARSRRRATPCRSGRARARSSGRPIVGTVVVERARDAGAGVTPRTAEGRTIDSTPPLDRWTLGGRRGGLARGRSIGRSIDRSVDRSIGRSIDRSIDARWFAKKRNRLERPRAGTSRRRVRRAMFSVTCAPSATTTTSCAVKATARSQRVRTIDRRDADARERVRTAPEDDDGAVSPSAPHRRHRRAIERDGSGCARRWGPRGVDGDDGVDTDGREGSRARRRGETSRRPRRRATARSGRVIQSDARD